MKNYKKLPRRIAFFGHFGMGNFGNESTLRAILYHVRRFLPDARLSCIATGPEDTTAIHNIKAIPISEKLFKSWKPRNPLVRLVRRFSVGVMSEIYRWAKTIRILRQTDMLIVPGTGLLTDAYGLLDWGPYNLFRWSLSAKLCRCKLLFVSVGAGPIYGVFGRWLVKSALSLADFRSYRDISSAQYLKSIGFSTRNDRVYPDLAFSLPDAVITDHAAMHDGKPVIGLGLMSYAGKYSVPNPRSETYLSYLNSLTGVVKWLVRQQYDVNLTIGNFFDMPVKHEFRRMLQEQLSEAEEEYIIDEPISCVEHLLRELAATDIVVATRYHTVLLALLNNKPVVALSFHPKCASLMDAMGLSEYCLDIHTLNSDCLIEKIRDLEKNASNLKPLIRDKTEEFRKALDEQYDLIFNGLSRRSRVSSSPPPLPVWPEMPSRREPECATLRPVSRRDIWAPQAVLRKMSRSSFVRKYLGRPYLAGSMWIWRHLPASLTSWRPARGFGAHLHTLIQLRSTRTQSVGTFFFRNRPELELLSRLLDQKGQGSTLDLAILACSKGAEAYSVSYTIRCSRPDLKVRLHAVDIDKDILEFAERGVYSLTTTKPSAAPVPDSAGQVGDVSATTFRNQNTSIFERMSSKEIEAMFDSEGELVKIKPRFQSGIVWHAGDARDPKLVDLVGLQDIVFANRFLCHMPSEDAEACLLNLARVVKPGGYVFVSGVDLAVRSKVARELGWRPVTQLIHEIHEGDSSLRRGWPLEYWGLEPFDQRRIDWKLRYASVFQCCGTGGEGIQRESVLPCVTEETTGERERELARLT
jgi:polysaccharide pyruvyl transferase WcaK-like protein/chemotaxis methyl-accepting protein methylase